MKSRGNKQSNKKGPGYRTPATFRFRQAIQITASRHLKTSKLTKNR